MAASFKERPIDSNCWSTSRRCVIGSVWCALLLCMMTGFQQSIRGDDVPSDVESAVPATEKPQPRLLRYTFRDGTDLRYSIVENLQMLVQRGESLKRDTTGIEEEKLLRVVSTDEDGTATLAIHLNHVRMELQTDDSEPEVYDSDRPESVPGRFQLFAESLKKPAAPFQVDARGRLIMQEDAATSSGEAEGDTAVQQASLEKSKEGELSDEQVVPDPETELVRAGFLLVLPEEPVTVGDSWKHYMIVRIRLTPDFTRRIPLLRTCRVENIDGDEVTIQLSTSIQAPVKSPQDRAQLINATPAGTVVFDSSRGCIVRREFRYDKMVLGVYGPQSQLTSVGKRVEKLSETNDAAGNESDEPARTEG